MQTLPVLPALLQASILALLSTSISLSMTLTATLIAVYPASTLVIEPSMHQLKLASSIHVLAFSSYGDLLVVESEGDFTIDTWDKVHQKARLICHGEDADESQSQSQDVSMTSDHVSKSGTALKDAVERKVAQDQRWKKTPE